MPKGYHRQNRYPHIHCYRKINNVVSGAMIALPFSVRFTAVCDFTDSTCLITTLFDRYLFSLLIIILRLQVKLMDEPRSDTHP